MKILIISYEEFDLHIGLNTRVKGLAKALREKNISVSIAVPCYSCEKSGVSDYEGIAVHRIFMKNFFGKNQVPIISRIIFVSHFTGEMKKYFLGRDERFDFVQAEQIYPFFCANILAKKFNAKVVLDDPTMLGYLAEDKLKKFRVINNIVQWLLQKFEANVYRKADYIFCSSQKTVTYINELLGSSSSKIKYAPNGVDANLYHYDSSKKFNNKIFFNCSLPYYQNLAALRNMVKVICLIVDQGFNAFTVTIIINNIKLIPDDIKSLLDKLPMVTVLSAVESLIPYIEDADVAMLPYEKGHVLTAGSRLKAVEALGAGKLVLATTEGVDGVLGCIDNENFILCADCEDMVIKVIPFFAQNRDTEQIKKIQHNARLLVEQEYSWVRVAGEYEKL